MAVLPFRPIVAPRPLFYSVLLTDCGFARIGPLDGLRSKPATVANSSRTPRLVFRNALAKNKHLIGAPVLQCFLHSPGAFDANRSEFRHVGNRLSTKSITRADGRCGARGRSTSIRATTSVVANAHAGVSRTTRRAAHRHSRRQEFRPRRSLGRSLAADFRSPIVSRETRRSPAALGSPCPSDSQACPAAVPATETRSPATPIVPRDTAAIESAT